MLISGERRLELWRKAYSCQIFVNVIWRMYFACSLYYIIVVGTLYYENKQIHINVV